MIAEPEWFDYVVWDYSDPTFPMMKGLKNGTPKEIVEEFERGQKQYEEDENNIY